VGIGLRSFASGLVVGIGPVLVLAMNGVVMGAVAGHLQAVGHGAPFWRFVAGHSPFELTAVVIAGGAGLRLGLDLLAPGRRRRVDALVEAGRMGARLCLGVFAMLVVAAFIEAFWSSIGWIPGAVKFAVGGLLWALVGLWLWRGGRSLADAP
ncbi:MAG: stage II sporulation protein M, partial [Lysobacteraceae bacterium]